MAEIDEATRRRLVEVVGSRHLILDPQLIASYVTDWTGRWSGSAAAVVRPASTEEVANVMQICSAAGIAMVPQGGNTGLVGGGVPRSGEVVLSTTRLRAVEAVNMGERSLTAEAGATLAGVEARAAAAGLHFGVDLPSRDSATIGGMAATNAGGMHVVAYGPMADNVRGLEAVLSDGTVITRLGGLPKESAGYDLPRLFTGSEGTLGVITRVKLRLVPAVRRRAAVLLAMQSLADAIGIAADLPHQLPQVQAVELILPEGMELVCRHAGMGAPFSGAYACYLLIEAGGQADVADDLAAAVAERPGVGDVAVAVGSDGLHRLRAYRERHSEAVATLGMPHKFDVAVPLDRLEPFLDALGELVAGELPGARCISWGHLAEGNLHVNLVPAAGTDARVIDAAVLGLVIAHGGTISAEHGVGVAKAAWLDRVRGDGDLRTMRAIKSALDPDWLMNPGVVFPSR